MAKALFFLTAVNGEIETLQADLTGGLPGRFDGDSQVTAQLMREPQVDFFYNPESSYPRPNLILEVVTAPGKPVAGLLPQLEQLLSSAALDRNSIVLLMQERKFIKGPPQPVYYHYLMLRKPGFSSADYIDYYSKFHCRMGLNTPNLGGYSQNYVDQAGSESLADALKLTCREVTSISEMKIPDMEKFISDPELMKLATPAALDEERFVDRSRSVAFTSEVILRLGDFEAIEEPVFEQHFPA